MIDEHTAAQQADDLDDGGSDGDGDGDEEDSVYSEYTEYYSRRECVELNTVWSMVMY